MSDFNACTNNTGTDTVVLGVVTATIHAKIYYNGCHIIMLLNEME